MTVLATAHFLFPATARAGAWTQPANGYYAKIEAVTLTTDEAWDETARRAPYAVDSLRIRTAEYRSRQVRGYFEYGLMPRLTGIVSLSYQRLEAEERAAIYKTNGFSDLRAGARFALPTRSLVTALAFEAKVPTGYKENSFPALGSHAADIIFSLQAGKSFRGGYATVEGGLTLRSGPLANEVPFSAELGINPVPRVQVRAILRGRSSLGTIEAAQDVDLNRVDSRTLNAAGAVVYAIRPDLDVEGALSRTISGKNSLAGTEFSVGLAVHR